MFRFTMENELQSHIIENFSSYFNFSFLAKEQKVISGRLDILGEDEKTIYIIELKRDCVDSLTIKQLQNYLENFATDKALIGIAAAPKIANDVDLTSIPENIWIRELQDVEYVPSPTTKVKASITLDEDVYYFLQEAAEMDDRSVSSYLNRVLKEWVKEKEGK